MKNSILSIKIMLLSAFFFLNNPTFGSSFSALKKVDNLILASGNAILNFEDTGLGIKPIFTFNGKSIVNFNEGKPISIELRSNATTKWYNSFYNACLINSTNDTVVCTGSIFSDNGTEFKFTDKYTLTSNAGSFELIRKLDIVNPSKLDISFNSSFGLSNVNASTLIDYDFFAPGLWYKNNSNLPQTALVANYSNNYFYFREDRLPLPLIMFREKLTGSTISLLHKNGNPETFLGEDGLSEIYDKRIQFGSIGVRQFDKTALVFNFPGSEGEKTYIYGSSVDNRWAIRRHPVTSDLKHEYKLIISFSTTESFENALKQTWVKSYNTYMPDIHKVDIQQVFNNQIDLLNFYWKDVSTAPGLPFSVSLPSGVPTGYSYNMGFIGMQIPCGYYLLRTGYEKNNQTLKDKGAAIIDWWAKNSLTINGLPKTWVDPPSTWRSFYDTYMRVAATGMEGALFAYNIMKTNGINKVDWLAFCKKFADWLVQNQNPDGSFYISYNYTTNLPSGISKTTTTNPIRYLIELYKITGENQYLQSAINAGEFSYKTVHTNYEYVGSVVDNPNVLDRESGQMAIDAFISLYDVTGEKKWLDAAVQAANFAETWIFSWKIPIPAGTLNPAFPLNKDCTGLALIATGHSAADNGFSYTAFQYYRLYLLTSNTHFLDIAQLIYNNAKQTMDLDGSLGYPYPALQTEAQQVCIPRGQSVLQWLPWNSAANLDPIFRFKDAFGTFNIDEIEKMPLDVRTNLNNQYGKTMGLRAKLFYPISSIIPITNMETEFKILASNPYSTIIKYNIIQQPSNGTLSGDAPNLKFIKTSNFSGIDSISFSISSQDMISDTVKVYFDGSAPLTPTDVKIKAASVNRLRIQWNPAYDNFKIKNYKIYRNDNLIDSTENEFYIDQGLNTNQRYSYKIRSTDMAGLVSNYSDSVYANTLALAPIIRDSAFQIGDLFEWNPTGQALVVNQDNSVSGFILNLKGISKIEQTVNVSPETNYTLLAKAFKTISRTDCKLIANINSSLNSNSIPYSGSGFMDVSVSFQTPRRCNQILISIDKTSIGGETYVSSVSLIKNNDLSSVNSIFNSMDLQVYPNPLRIENPIKIDSNSPFINDKVSISVCDIQGKLIYNNDLNISGNTFIFNPNIKNMGIYILSLTSKNLLKKIKLIIE